MITSLIPSFNGGELSPQIHLRSDLEKYRSGCRTLRNMLITPYGGARRRKGFRYVATSASKVRLFRFQVADVIGYIVEFSAEAIRFFRSGEPVKDGDDEDYIIESPYAADDLAELQMVQINNVAYLTHPAYPPQKLVRYGNAEWVITPVDFTYPAVLEENLDKTKTIQTTAGFAGADVDLVASFDLFTAAHVGAAFQISHERPHDQFEVELEAESGNDGLNSDNLIVQGAWSINTFGTWDGVFLVERSDDNGSSWQTIRQFTSDEDRNFTAGGEEPGRVLLRLKYEHNGGGSSNPRAVLAAEGAFIRGLVIIQSVESPTEATAQVKYAVEAGTTSYWREGAWSTYRGFPRTVAAHEQRIIYAGNAFRASTVWASGVDDYENFEPGVDDSDSWSHTIVSDQQNSIQWMVSAKALIIGTSGDEWALSSSKADAIITPTNVRVRRQSRNGSRFMPAQMVNDSILFVQRGGKKVRELGYSLEADGYVTNDLTLLAEHVTGAGIVDMAYQEQPLPTLWCVTKGGELIALTYDRGQKIAGWHRHTTGGNGDGFEAVAVKSVAGQEDQVWVSVRRTINDEVVRYIERLQGEESFIEEGWDLLWGDPSSEPEWSDLIQSFETGARHSPYPADPSETTYVAISPHRADENANWPLGDWFTDAALWYPVAMWYDGISNSYVAGDHVFIFGESVEYECILDHDPSDPRKPGEGVDWETYWVEVGPHATGTAYVPQESYEEGAEVSADGRLYTALGDHTPDASLNEPGEGSDWETYWEIYQGQYTTSQRVSVDGVNYIALSEHVPTLDSQPGFGPDWTDFWVVQDENDLMFYVDCGITVSPFDGEELDGLDHLEGETVQILADGAVLPSRVVTEGAIQFTEEEIGEDGLTTLSVGLAYESILEPMALEVGLQNGTSLSREKRIHEMVIYFFETIGAKVSDKLAGPFDNIPFRTGDQTPGDAIPLFTGPIVHKLDSRHDLEASFVIKQDLPLPMSVVAVVPKWNVNGDQG